MDTEMDRQTVRFHCIGSGKNWGASSVIQTSDTSSEEDEKEFIKPSRVYGRRFSNVMYTNGVFKGDDDPDKIYIEPRSKFSDDPLKCQNSNVPCVMHSLEELFEPDSPYNDLVKSKQPSYMTGRRSSNAYSRRYSFSEPPDDTICTCRDRSFSDSFDGISYNGAMDNVSNRVYISLFWNTFGRKGKDKGELGDATHVHHIYKGVTLITDRSNSRMQFFSKTGNYKFEIDMGSEYHPTSSVITNEGDIVCTLPEHSRVVLVDLNGTIKKVFESDDFKAPSGIAIDNKNIMYVTDTKANKVFVLHPNGSVIGSLGQERHVAFSNPRHVTVCKYSQNILISDSGNNCIKVFDKCGELIQKFGRYGRGDGQFRFPCGITTDIRGNIIVADHYNDRVSLFAPDGEFLHHIIGPERNIKRPQGIELRPGKKNPKLYVTHGNLMASRVSVFKLRDPSMSDIEVEVLGKV